MSHPLPQLVGRLSRAPVLGLGSGEELGVEQAALPALFKELTDWLEADTKHILTLTRDVGAMRTCGLRGWWLLSTPTLQPSPPH